MIRRSAKYYCQIDVTAFVGTMLVLLVLLLGPLTGGRWWPSIDLAVANHPIVLPKANREDATMIAVSKDGKIYVNSDQVLPDVLLAKVRKSISEGSQNNVYIRADARAKYGNVKEVIDQLRAGGIENVDFITFERRKSASEIE